LARRFDYAGIQIKSLDERTVYLEQQIDKKLDERTKAVTDSAGDAQKNIDKQTTNVNTAAGNAIGNAAAQEELVKKKLAVDQLPNIQQLKPQLQALAESGGKLNLHCLSLLSGYAIWVLFGMAGLSLLLSAYAAIRSHR